MMWHSKFECSRRLGFVYILQKAFMRNLVSSDWKYYNLNRLGRSVAIKMLFLRVCPFNHWKITIWLICNLNVPCFESQSAYLLLSNISHIYHFLCISIITLECSLCIDIGAIVGF